MNKLVIWHCFLFTRVIQIQTNSQASKFAFPLPPEKPGEGERDYVRDCGEPLEGQDPASRKLAYSLEANMCLQHSLFVR